MAQQQGPPARPARCVESRDLKQRYYSESEAEEDSACSAGAGVGGGGGAGAGALWRAAAAEATCAALLVLLTCLPSCAQAPPLQRALAAGALVAALVQVVRPRASVWCAQAVCVEALLGAVLALANCASWDARNRRLLDSWPLRIGLTVAALTLAAVYCVGPPAGALCAAALYRCVWRAPRGARARGRDPPAAPRPAPPPAHYYTT